MKRRFENMEIRSRMFANGIFQEDLARVFGVRRETINTQLAKPMTEEQQKKYFDAIESIIQAGGARV